MVIRTPMAIHTVMAMRERTASDTLPSELLTWFSPSFPTGGFAYSQGLETAVSDGLVRNADALKAWVRTGLMTGGLWVDLVMLSRTMRAEGSAEVTDITDYLLALQVASERVRETLELGRNFQTAVEAGWDNVGLAFAEIDRERLPLPIACGVAARACALDVTPTLVAFANAAISAQCNAAIRLSVVGQFGGVRIQSALAPEISEVCRRASVAEEADVVSSTFAADIATMRHETQTARLFQS